jgi:hypothetical protein
MLITFKSKGAGDLHMFGEHAEQILATVGKSLEPANAPKGIITAAEAPAALARLREAANASRSANQVGAEDSADSSAPIDLAQRAFPFIALLERAVARQVDIVWGV